MGIPERYLLWLAMTPALVLAVNAVLSRFAMALKLNSPPQLITVISALTAFPVSGAASWVLFPDIFKPQPLVPAFYGITVYWSLAYSYFHVFNMSETARRIRILRELSHKISTREELAGLYESSGMLSARLERLCGMGQLERRGGRYALSGRVLWLAAHFVHAWGRVLGLTDRRRRSV